MIPELFWAGMIPTDTQLSLDFVFQMFQMAVLSSSTVQKKNEVSLHTKPSGNNQFLNVKFKFNKDIRLLCK